MPESLPDSDSLALLGEWRTLLRANDLAESTVHGYCLAMWRLLEHHELRIHPLDITESHIAAFLASLGNRAPAKEQYAKGVRSFYTWAVHRGYLLTSPLGLIKPRRVKRARPVRFEVDELVRILIAASWRNPRRAWAILACVALGCRRAELVGLKVTDLDFERRRVHILGKGRKHRDIDMNGLAFEALSELMALSNGDGRVLPIEPNTFNDWVKKAIADAGIDPVKNGRRRTAHTFRATFASILLDDGAPPQVVQELLGHESLATTSAYAAIGEQHTTREAVTILENALRSRARPE